MGGRTKSKMAGIKLAIPYRLEKGNPLVPDFEPAYPSLDARTAAEYEARVKEDYHVSDLTDPRDPNGYKGWKVTYRGEEEILFSPNARAITTEEYLRKDELNTPTEDILDLIPRIAVNIATAEKKYNPKADVVKTAKKFAYRMMKREFVPNTPTFANAGGHLQQLAACFAMVLDDYLATDDIGEDPDKQGNGIFDIGRYAAMIQKSGGGTGFNFSYTRPKNSGIATTGGRASGPVSWLLSLNAITSAINQGGFRRGANMGVLEYWHPDIFEFLTAKHNYKIPFFNLSMGVDKGFWDAFDREDYFCLVSPRDRDKVPLEKRVWTADRLVKKSKFDSLSEEVKEDLSPSLLLSDDGKKVIVNYTGKEVGIIDDEGRIKISAKATLEYAAEIACKTGCPGIIDFGKMNEDNSVPHIGEIRAVNPCGEQPLLSFEACNLGSVNIYSCVKEVAKESFEEPGLSHNKRYFFGRVIGEGEHAFQKRLDLKKLEGIVVDGVRFLDNVIDMGKYPFKKIYHNVKSNRKIGLGVMGIAETAASLGIEYESEQMEQLSEFLSSFIYRKAFMASRELGEERGSFPNWGGSIYDPDSEFAVKEKTGPMRNANVMTIAPNGTTGRHADVTGGIEPQFGIYYAKKITGGPKLFYRDQVFEDEMERRGLFSQEIVDKIVNNGKSIQGITEIPEDIQRRYKLCTEVDPLWHVRIQAAWQRGTIKDGTHWGTDNAVSKTVNLPEESTPDSFYQLFLEARKRGCKGITGYRQNTIPDQPLTIDTGKKAHDLGEIVWNYVPINPGAMSIADNSNKYRVFRPLGSDEEVFHIMLTDELRRHKKTGKLYFFPREDFQMSSPPGDEIAVEFTAAGIDRTLILKGPDPDYAKIVETLKSVTGNMSTGLGPYRVNSPTHAVGLALEHALQTRGILQEDPDTKRLINAVRKPETELVPEEEKAQILRRDANGEAEQNIANKKVARFKCKDCGSTDYIFEQGCHEPLCKKCGHSNHGTCG